MTSSATLGGLGLEAWRKLTRRWKPVDWKSPSKPPETCNQSRKSKFDRIAGCIGALGRTGFEVPGIPRTNKDRVETYRRTS